MNNAEAKKTLEAIGGLLLMIKMTSETKLPPELDMLFDRYDEAMCIAIEAIDIMDNKIDIESKGGAT